AARGRARSRSRRARSEPRPRSEPVGAGVDPLQPLHLVDVVARLRELDADALRAPAVDIRLAGVVSGEGRSLVAVLVQQVTQVPAAVADVDLRVLEIGRDESAAARARRD